MRIGQIFLPESFSYSEERAVASLPTLISPKAATAKTPFLLYEAPITALQFVGFVLKPDPNDGRFWGTIIDLSGAWKESDLPDEGLLLPGRYYPPPPPEFQKLVENAAQEFQPMLDGKVSPSELVSVWANQPETHRTFIDRRKNPGEINRQNSYIILNWLLWELHKVPLKERVTKISGDGFGNLTPKSLQKRAERLNLSVDFGDNPAELVAYDLLAPRKFTIS